jgi:hypothetical protein
MATRIGVIATLALAIASAGPGVAEVRAATSPPARAQLSGAEALIESGPLPIAASSGGVSSWRVRVREVASEPAPRGTDTALAQAAQSYYLNPLRDIRRLRADRIDEGVDYGGSGPVKALGDATLTVVDRGNSYFWAHVDGNVVVEQLDTGPLLGLRIYIAENCTPAGSLYVGERVTADTTLCLLHNRFPYLETGFAQPGRDGVPAAWPVYALAPDGSQTAYGLDFSRLLGDLGAPPGNTGGEVSYRPWSTVGALAPGFPAF